MVNPMLVEGQIRAGVVQGIDTPLFKEIPYDETGNLSPAPWQIP